ncbi:MAG: winged helix-turn-helix transcriptional regulator, partial [Candidatus Methanomethylophilaceae archaeon]|nr:winged helix-turn-helix transcriptional regulator [Candidatus Methanomethylophilaceae archaeon]
MSDNEIYWNSYLPVFLDRMSMSMREHMTESVSQYGLTSAHAVYLIALELQGPMSQKELSEFLDMDPANTNRVIKVLRSKGMIYDDRITEQSRNYKIYLTEIGKKLARKTMDETNDWMNSILEDIPFEDILNMRNTLIRVLQKMGTDIDNYMGSEYTNPFYTYLMTNPPVDGKRFHKSNLSSR